MIMTNSPQKSVLLAGCGDIGLYLGQQLQQAGYQVIGLKRSPLENPPFPMVYADLLAPDSLGELAEQYDFIVYTATPSSMTPQAYEDAYVNGLKHLMSATQPPAHRLLLVSSTGVYHQSAGEWVDESCATYPERFSGKILLQSEQIALSQWPTTVIRFAGIYGPGRLRLINKVQRGEPVSEVPASFTNRIFRDDCAGMLAFLMVQSAAGQPLDSVYIGCDDAPVTDVEVLDYIADCMALPRLPRAEPQQPAGTAQNKRCCNDRIKSLGYGFAYPSYREGYERILREAGLLRC